MSKQTMCTVCLCLQRQKTFLLFCVYLSYLSTINLLICPSIFLFGPTGCLSYLATVFISEKWMLEFGLIPADRHSNIAISQNQHDIINSSSYHLGLYPSPTRGQAGGEAVRHQALDPERGHPRHSLLQGEGDQCHTHEHKPGQDH